MVFDFGSPARVYTEADMWIARSWACAGVLFASVACSSSTVPNTMGNVASPTPQSGTGAGSLAVHPDAAIGGSSAAIGGSGAALATAGGSGVGVAGNAAIGGGGVGAGTSAPVAGISGAAGSGAAVSDDSRGTGPGDWVAGDYPKGLDTQTYLEISGLPGQPVARQYKVHVPPSYDPQQPMPVVFCIHGLGQDALLFCLSGAGMPAKSDSAGFILVMPNGYQNSWNAGTCCGGAASSMLDDVGFIRAIFKEISSHLNIDQARVYATGLSNGGYLSYRLACEAADLFVAVAPGAGAIGMNDIGGGTGAVGDFKACMPSAKVSVLDLHGTADPLIPYALQKPSTERIATANGCKLTTHAAVQPVSGGDTTCVAYDGCPTGIDVTACSVEGGGHVWFGSENCGTGADGACAIVGANSTSLVNTDVTWDFFKAHSRP